MKNCFETIAVAFSMFSAVPVKQVEWTEKNRKYSLLAFPLVGVLSGVLWVAMILVLNRFLPEVPLLTGALLTALPLLITGGIHLDGYADTYDALSSHAETERKLEIMQDPHTGAFATMHVGVFLLAWFAAAASVSWTMTDGFLMLLAFPLSRTLSALAVATFPLAKNTGLVHAFAEDADRKKVRNGCLAILLLLTLGLMAVDIVGGWFPAGICMWVAAVGTFAWYYRTAVKQFGGTTGDVAGWFVCKCELYMLIALAVAENL